MNVARGGIPLLPAEARESAPLVYQVLFFVSGTLLVGSLVAGIFYSFSEWQRPPGLAINHHRLGIEWQKRGQWDLAAKEYRSVNRIEPFEIFSIKNSGEALAKLGDLDGELDVYVHAYELMPQNAEVNNLLSKAFHKRGAINSSIFHAKEALRLRPDFGWPHVTLGGVWVQKGNLEEAQKEFVEAIRLDPFIFEAFMGLGVVLAYRGDLRNAEKCFAEAVWLRPDDEKAKSMLANARYQLEAATPSKGTNPLP